jgi:hypothetical protein
VKIKIRISLGEGRENNVVEPTKLAEMVFSLNTFHPVFQIPGVRAAHNQPYNPLGESLP